MPKATKLIMRFDFKKFSRIATDNRGLSLSIIEDVEPDFWDNIGFSKNSLGVNATSAKDFLYHRVINADINNINFSIEYIADGGIEISDIYHEDSFKTISSIVDNLLSKYEVNDMARVGIRLAMVDKTNTNFGDFLNSDIFLSKNILSNVNKSEVEISDFSLTFEGSSPDLLNYRMTFGPLAQKNIERNLYNAGKVDQDFFMTAYQYDFMCDCDIYELDFSFRQHKVARWSKGKLEKMSSIFRHISGRA